VTICSRTRIGLVVSLLMAAPALGLAQTPAPVTPGAPATPASQAPTQPPPEPERQGRGGRPSRREPAADSSRGSEPPRASRDPGPIRQELTFTANLLGGYDDNLTAGLGTGAGVAPTAMASGSTASLDATLNYFKGNQRRSFRMDTTGNVLAYPDYFDQPVAGGTASIDAQTAMGRANTISVYERAGYEPLVNVLSPGGNGVVLPPELGAPAPTTGLYDRQSFSSNSRIALDTQWGRRDTTTVGYGYSLRNFLDDPSEENATQYGDNRSHSATATYRRTLSASVKARGDYRYQNLETETTAGTDSTDVLTIRPTRTHRIEGGTDVAHALTRRGRALSWTLTAGAGRIETLSSTSSTGQLPQTAWLPMGRATVTLAFSSRWSLDGAYSRDFSLLQGVTNEVYATDSVSVTTGGSLARRTNLRVGGTYGNWKTPIASGVDDTFNIYGGMVLLRQFLTDTVALTASYNYYHHAYSNPAALPEGFPSNYDRNAFRVGVTVAVPLVGAPNARAASAVSR
jgi:hypothetical protein